jgi:universal stress protein E
MIHTATRFLAVIDPTRDEQWALQKAVAMAKAQPGATIVAFLCVHSAAKCDEPERLQNVELCRCRSWLDRILLRFAGAGVAIEPVVEWHSDWRQAVCEAAQSLGTDLVIKRASGRPSSLASSDRRLIRTLKDAPLLLVKHDPAGELRKVLVALDLNATDEAHVALNDAIIALGRQIRGSNPDIELHSICAYSSSDRFVHPPDIARMLGIERSQAHVSRGVAAEAIPRMANTIQADLVIVGNTGRRGLSGVTVGNTAEKILTDIEADVLVLVHEARQEKAPHKAA